MKQLLDSIRALPLYTEVLNAARSGARFPGLGLPRAARLPILAALHEDLGVPVLLLTDRADRALEFTDELSFWLPKSPHYLFPEPNPLFYEEAAWGSTSRRERIQTLTALAAWHLPFVQKPNVPPVIVASARAVMVRTLPRRDFLKNAKRLSVGDEISLGNLLENWVRIGYERVDTVLETGQFSHRGGLLDIWPPAERFPVRLDFFGDELDTMRSFDAASQRTVESLSEILITPAREYILANFQPPAPAFQPSEFHIPLLHSFPASLFDYLPKSALVLIDDIGTAEAMVNEIEEQAVRFRQESIQEETLDADFPVPYLTWSELEDSLYGHPMLELGYATALAEMPSDFGVLPRFNGRLKPFVDFLAGRIAAGDEMIVVSRQADRLAELWRERHAFAEAEYRSPTFLSASLSGGWRLMPHPDLPAMSVSLITDSEIFGWERPRPRRRQRQVSDAPEAAYADLSPGDWVVHIDHGIGRYVGLVQRSLEGHEREFLCVEYKDADQLFVPVHQADRLTRYIGPDGGRPSLSRLGGESWQQAKGRVRKAVEAVAEDLLDLYARRKIARGFAFSPDTPWQRELESSFPYVETEDQLRVIEDVKRDMESARPMDRLLCGDVGYGKTEIALRAAFKAVMDGRQVAILVPTTVLAQQHFETFRKRLAAFPVNVEMLSRFRKPREQTKILFDLAYGGVDIIIGTHRLMSSDVLFKDLGLVIIDEEQRFGVAHKEHLKKLRTEVDVLTMTATPIPRTLYMALTGVRDISNLNTPPEERLPVVTHVGPYAPKLVRQAILREMDRGGQVFFVHNRVQTIRAMKAHVQKLVPEARIAIGHGQMAEGRLSKVMSDFVAGKVDVLLSTTIIESGMDIPNANTLIVDRGDTFGLAQLYQLRGRVGRGAVRAYAYFFRHRKKMPTQEGQARLEVIAENTQLGAGYSIAMRDLEIRGAGDLLGTRQHGHIASVGFHLYTRLLKEAVEKSKFKADGEGQKIARLPALKPANLRPVNVDFPFAIGIPPTYIPDQTLRLRLYRRLANIADESELDALRIEFADRFGDPPEMVENLFYQIAVKLRAEKSGLASVVLQSGQIALRYPPLAEGQPHRLLRDLGPAIRKGKNAYWLAFGGDPDWRERLLAVLETLN
ncbi:MAG: transcription-repair coupling factor [Anaerolineales bacterium]|nr:transcription-repair coupling factor [Anaerolineales bacterium]